MEIPTVYDPRVVEQKWYRYWEEKGYFRAFVNPKKPPFSIVIPPPNVTGSLHVGHVVPMTLQDIITRYRRMQGYETLWLPGTDHAGIATQNVVERELAREGLTRHDLGWEKFLERVWQWKEEYGNTIIEQLKRLGASCDWTRTRFTMDEGCSRAVREVFVRLYEKGLIYRGDYMINWCPQCKTALSDIEVEHEDTEGKLWHVRYPLEDNPEEGIVVATTRPETILGDTAVAVHPDDERYRHLVGKTVLLPIIKRRLPVIADRYVDPEFGTGAVKITPAHDPNDFDVGQRHRLPSVKAIDEDGCMTAEAGPYRGMERYQCREKLLDDLREQGYLVRVDGHLHAVGRCYRCDSVVEPLVSRQWFVKMRPLADPAIAAVVQGETRFVPERFTRVYTGWLENIKDWCISRQIWWGHRIPAWYCGSCGETIVSTRDPASCTRCGSEKLTQDEDVLDTWFSSALWPFSTMGWPEKTPELEYFYPTSVLVTGYDIIFFWVARMIFMSLEFMHDVPFLHVFINGLVRDVEGKKMSKSRGNTLDPLEIIEEFGADTLRFSVVTGTAPGNDIRLYREKLEGVRNFANKIWNASRFVLMNLEGFDPGAGKEEDLSLTLADHWILSRLSRVIRQVTEMMEAYDFGGVCRTLHDFLWSEFCDWYIELAKPRLYGEDGQPHGRYTARFVLWHVLERTMKLLHPFMPFITEEIWQRLPHQGDSIMRSAWPLPRDELRDETAERKMEEVMGVIKAIRNLRAENNILRGQKVEVILCVSPGEVHDALEEARPYIVQLADASPLRLVRFLDEKPKQAATAIAGGVEIYIPLRGVIDLEREVQRLTRELEEARGDLQQVEKKLASDGFLARAPAAVVEKEKAKKAEYQERIARLEARLASLQE